MVKLCSSKKWVNYYHNQNNDWTQVVFKIFLPNFQNILKQVIAQLDNNLCI